MSLEHELLGLKRPPEPPAVHLSEERAARGAYPARHPL